MAKLSNELHAAYNWIDAAGEFSIAIEDPAKYAAESAKNWRDNSERGDTEITESDLLQAIEFERLARTDPHRVGRRGHG